MRCFGLGRHVWVRQHLRERNNLAASFCLADRAGAIPLGANWRPLWQALKWRAGSRRILGSLAGVLVLGALGMGVQRGWAQAVEVSIRLDTNTIALGDTTQLRVFAQVVPALRPTAERIFSWYLDVLNADGTVALANYDVLARPASDNDPLTSSSGQNEGSNRRGIYDTFLNRPGAGVASAVELLSIPVTGLAPGTAQFRVEAGTGVAFLSEDFIVAPLGGGDFLSGGNYSNAVVQLTVQEGCRVTLQIARVELGGPDQEMVLSFIPCPGYVHTVEFRDVLQTGPSWQPLPGAPHNSGSVTVTNTVPSRFYRVRSERP